MDERGLSTWQAVAAHWDLIEKDETNHNQHQRTSEVALQCGGMSSLSTLSIACIRPATHTPCIR
eukprot:1739167-Amphidinium_carterae.2